MYTSQLAQPRQRTNTRSADHLLIPYKMLNPSKHISDFNFEAQKCVFEANRAT